MAGEKKNEVVKKASKPAKEGNIFYRAWQRIKKFFKDEKGECKKVVWPSAKTVVKSSLVVLAVVLITGLVIFGIDQGLSALLSAVQKLAGKVAENSDKTNVMINAFFGF